MTGRYQPRCCPICQCIGMGKPKRRIIDGRQYDVQVCRFCRYEDEIAVELTLRSARAGIENIIDEHYKAIGGRNVALLRSVVDFLGTAETVLERAQGPSA